jgi:hypothetical protein
MGTRADFYTMKGESIYWLGSAPFDGYDVEEAEEGGDRPECAVKYAKTQQTFVASVMIYFAKKTGARLPDHGWPWPWKDSNTTDRAYIWDENDHKLRIFHFGTEVTGLSSMDADDLPDNQCFPFPDMRNIQNVTGAGFLILRT